MATPAYVPLDANAPAGLTQAPAAYSASDLANVRALRDMVVSGLGDSAWDFSQNPVGWQNPNYYLWKNAATGAQFKANMTYVGAPSFSPATVTWQWSNDSGATFVQIGAVVNLACDAAGIINSASSLAGNFINALAARTIAVNTIWSTTNHANAQGTAVHGLGTMSTQNANNVNVSGGNIGGTLQTGNVYIQMARVSPLTPLTLATGVAWNWGGNSGVHMNAAPGTVIPNIVGPAAGEIKRVYVSGAGAITINSGGGVNFVWATGHPVWGATATLVCFVALAGNTVLGTTVPI